MRELKSIVYAYFQSPSNVVVDEDLNISAIAKDLIDLTCCYISQLKNEMQILKKAT